MKDIIISSDSTCDLSEALIAKYDIEIMSLSVMLGAQTYRDGIDIVPADIFRYFDETGELPKTAAPSVEEYAAFFRKYTDQGKTVVHINISSKASGSYGFARTAAEQFDGKVFVVDSHALSTGQGLLVLKAADLRAEGKSAKEIYDELLALRVLRAFRLRAVRRRLRRGTAVRVFRRSSRLRLCSRLLFQSVEIVVAAGVNGQFFVRDLDDLACDVLYEISVVRDEQEGAFVLFERVLERFPRQKVEVVGRFVQNEEVRAFRLQKD